MYDAKDPRASLAAAPASVVKAATEFAGVEYARFHDMVPQESTAGVRTWYARGQNFVLAYTEAETDCCFTREMQTDEFAVLSPDAAGRMEISFDGKVTAVPGGSLVFVPPGRSEVRLPAGGRLIRLFTLHATDLVARCSNAESYRNAHPNVAPLAAWPAPVDGYRVRAYRLDVPAEEGRFGRIWRCSTFMVNYLDVRVGPREVTKMSPHSHADFEQCSLALSGEFVHHIRWPWTTNMNHWREDEHALCGTPSIAVIPPPAIHTTQATGSGANQLVDIFCPPRVDFSLKPGWVLNADEYPMPA
jgi:hypothetical protein